MSSGRFRSGGIHSERHGQDGGFGIPCQKLAAVILADRQNSPEYDCRIPFIFPDLTGKQIMSSLQNTHFFSSLRGRNDRGSLNNKITCNQPNKQN